MAVSIHHPTKEAQPLALLAERYKRTCCMKAMQNRICLTDLVAGNPKRSMFVEYLCTTQIGFAIALQ